MGLRIIYGKSGSGKSSFCFNEISKIINKEKKIYIITPEQFSFTAEKKLLDAVNTNSVINAEVITLSRMAHRVLLEVGGEKERLTKTGRAMLTYSILSKNIKNLKFLGKSDENIDIVNRSLKEFKKHGIGINKLEEEVEKAKKSDNKYLQTKLEDIIIIYKEFEEKIKDRFIEETDILTSLVENISKTDFLDDAIVYIDEFAGFTKQEYMVINEILRLSKQVNITMCIDNLETNTNPDVDIYYSNKKTLLKLMQNIKEKDIEIEERIECKDLHRFKTKELNHLANNMYASKMIKYEENTNNINMFLAKNQYLEIENIAKSIDDLIKTKGYRYKDIGIITKSLENYSSLIKNIFEKYNIPVFIDEKRELSQNIIVKYILAITELISSNLSNYALFNYLKLGFLDIEDDSIYELENYATAWGIKNNKWKNDFKYGKIIEKEESNISDKNKEINKRIDDLNEIRKQIINPIIRLKENIDKEKTYLGITKQIYRYIIDNDIENKIENKIEELRR